MEEKRKPAPKMKSSSDSDLDIYFEYFVGSYRPGLVHQSRKWHPAADVHETESCVLIKVDIAGIDPDELELILDKEHLILQGVRRETLDGERKRMLAMEIHYGPFQRIFPLPSPVCADKVKATYRSGFLTIRLQKRDKPLQRKMKVKIHEGDPDE